VALTRWRSSALLGLGVALTAAVGLTGCTASGGSKTAASTPASTGSAAGPTTTSTGPTVAPSTTVTATGPAAAARLTLRTAGSKNVSPVAPVQVGVAGGRLSSVALVNAAGKHVTGTLAEDKTSWKAAEPLGYGKKYTLSASAVNADGKAVHKKTSFTTLTPDRLAMPYFNNPALMGLTDNATYGVGMVVNVHWDRPITDRAAAEKTMTVTTAPAVTGSWYWVDDQNVHWRPRVYYTTGTKVTVTVADYGKKLGDGLYGQGSKTLHFTIGVSHVSIADDTTHHVKVYENGKLVRDMPTSMGRGGSQVIKGRTITYWTPSGTYTVVGHFNPKLMDSTTYGLPLDQGGYKEYIYYATRISTGGIYMHQMGSTVAAQGHRDVSHGCLNLSPANAKWFYSFAKLGDVVTVKHTGGAALEVWQGGDWSLPWSQWTKGSALS
jgi:lipoprotein-anchoring transpeptidase ErfK/SrfK